MWEPNFFWICPGINLSKMRANIAYIPPLLDLAKTKALGTTIFYNLKYNDAKYVKIKTDYTNKKAQF